MPRPVPNGLFSAEAKIVVLREPEDEIAAPTEYVQTHRERASCSAGADCAATVPEPDEAREIQSAEHGQVLSAHARRAPPRIEHTCKYPNRDYIQSEPPRFFVDSIGQLERPVRPAAGTSDVSHEPLPPAPITDESPPSPSLSLESLEPVTVDASPRAPLHVDIRGWHAIGHGVTGWIVYDIVLATRGVRITQKRRFREFVGLRNELARERPVRIC